MLGWNGSRRGGRCRSRSRGCRLVDRRRLGGLEASEPGGSLMMMMRGRIGGLGLDRSWLETSPGVGLGWARLRGSTSKERLGDGVSTEGRGGVGVGSQARRGLGHHGRRVVPSRPVGDGWSEAWPGLVRHVLRGGGRNHWSHGSQGRGGSSRVRGEEVRLAGGLCVGRSLVASRVIRVAHWRLRLVVAVLAVSSSVSSTRSYGGIHCSAASLQRVGGRLTRCGVRGRRRRLED